MDARVGERKDGLVGGWMGGLKVVWCMNRWWEMGG